MQSVILVYVSNIRVEKELLGAATKRIIFLTRNIQTPFLGASICFYLQTSAQCCQDIDTIYRWRRFQSKFIFKIRQLTAFVNKTRKFAFFRCFFPQKLC